MGKRNVTGSCANHLQRKYLKESRKRNLKIPKKKKKDKLRRVKKAIKYSKTEKE